MSIITTFENQCRALTSAPSLDDNASRFLVGTQSTSQDNLLYLFEYKDDNNNLAKVSFKFPYGESWHLSTSNKHINLVTDVTSNNGKFSVSLFKLPHEVHNPIEDDYGLSDCPVEKLFDLITDDKNLTRQCHWHPDDGDELLTCNDGKLSFWDINQEKKRLEFSIAKTLERFAPLDIEGCEIKQSKVTDLRWSSLFNCSVIAAAVGSKIYGIDTRIPDSSPSSVCWLVDDRRCNRVRSIDFNPNSQYYLASGGEDCRANFWDLRQTSEPALHIQTHTHWIWSIRYNPFHDQLVLSAGSDARVALVRAQSIASEPFGQTSMLDDDDFNQEGDEEEVESNTIVDECCDKSDGHDDINGCKDKKVDRLLPTSRRSSIEQHSCDTTTGSKISGSHSGAAGDTRVANKRLADEVISLYEEHDDSVYAVEWATDPWMFASLGYESRLIINKVPKAEKFNILF